MFPPARGGTVIFHISIQVVEYNIALHLMLIHCIEGLDSSAIFIAGYKYFSEADVSLTAAAR